MNSQDMLVNKNITLKEAMNVMDELRISTLFVVNDLKQLQGCITDGDIRRAILKQVPINEPIDLIMNPSPMKITTTDLVNKEIIKQKMKASIVNHIPLVNHENIIQKIYSLSYFSENPNPHFEPKTSKVIIMAGGEGSRLRPLTGILPKPLAPLGDKPIVQRIIENFRNYGFNNFKLSVNYMAEMIKTYFDYIKSDFSISFINENKLAGKKLGTAGAISLIKDELDEPFFVSNCDVLIDANYNEILTFHNKSGNLLTIIGALRNTKIPYGVLNIKDDGTLYSITEKPEYDHLINTGMYVLSPSAVNYIPLNEQFNMTDLMSVLINQGLKVGIFPIRANQWFDIGQWKEYENVLKNVENKEFEFKQG